MVMSTLFQNDIPGGCTVIRMLGELSDCKEAPRDYEQKPPEAIEVLLLSVDPDGHIASLSPGENAILEKSKSVVPEIAPNPLTERLTITPRIF
jgi:6-phosphogluconolactonase